MLEERPQKLEAQKKFEVGYLSVYTDLYDTESGEAYMLDRPLKAADRREAGFLTETAKLRPQEHSQGKT